MAFQIVSTYRENHRFALRTVALGALAVLFGLDEFLDHTGPIHLVLTDVILPQLSGRELVERLRLSHPEIRVLFMSGYDGHAIAEPESLPADARFLPKPFSTRDLLKAVREALTEQDRDPPRLPSPPAGARRAMAEALQHE